MKAKIIFYKQGTLNQKEKFNLRRDLLGIEQKSNFGRYNYKVKGVLDEIPHYKPFDSTIIIEAKNLIMLKEVLSRHNVNFEIFDMDIPQNKLKVK